jgi:hypothetical protein
MTLQRRTVSLIGLGLLILCSVVAISEQSNKRRLKSNKRGGRARRGGGKNAEAGKRLRNGLFKNGEGRDAAAWEGKVGHDKKEAKATGRAAKGGGVDLDEEEAGLGQADSGFHDYHIHQLNQWGYEDQAWTGAKREYNVGDTKWRAVGGLWAASSGGDEQAKLGEVGLDWGNYEDFIADERKARNAVGTIKGGGGKIKGQDELGESAIDLGNNENFVVPEKKLGNADGATKENGGKRKRRKLARKARARKLQKGSGNVFKNGREKDNKIAELNFSPIEQYAVSGPIEDVKNLLKPVDQKNVEEEEITTDEIILKEKNAKMEDHEVAEEEYEDEDDGKGNNKDEKEGNDAKKVDDAVTLEQLKEQAKEELEELAEKLQHGLSGHFEALSGGLGNPAEETNYAVNMEEPKENHESLNREKVTKEDNATIYNDTEVDENSIVFNKTKGGENGGDIAYDLDVATEGSTDEVNETMENEINELGEGSLKEPKEELANEGTSAGAGSNASAAEKVKSDENAKGEAARIDSAEGWNQEDPQNLAAEDADNFGKDVWEDTVEDEWARDEYLASSETRSPRNSPFSRPTLTPTNRSTTAQPTSSPTSRPTTALPTSSSTSRPTNSSLSGRPSSPPAIITTITPTNYANFTPIHDIKQIAQTDCQLCSDGGDAANPSRTLMGTTTTCQDLKDQFKTFNPDECALHKAAIPIDLEAYCGCNGASLTSQCTFCPPQTRNIYRDVNIPALNDWTCGEVEEYTTYITDQTVCANMVHLSNLCCGRWDEYWRTTDAGDPPHDREAFNFEGSKDTSNR